MKTTMATRLMTMMPGLYSFGQMTAHESVNSVMKKADNGDTSAMIELCECYENTLGVECLQ